MPAGGADLFDQLRRPIPVLNSDAVRFRCRH